MCVQADLLPPKLGLRSPTLRSDQYRPLASEARRDLFLPALQLSIPRLGGYSNQWRKWRSVRSGSLMAAGCWQVDGAGGRIRLCDVRQGVQVRWRSIGKSVSLGFASIGQCKPSAELCGRRTAYASFGGLLMALTGQYRHLSSITVGDNVYLLARK